MKQADDMGYIQSDRNTQKNVQKETFYKMHTPF